MYYPGVQAEKEHDQFKAGIEGFPKDGLHHVDPAVKNPLPDPESMYYWHVIFAYRCNFGWRVDYL